MNLFIITGTTKGLGKSFLDFLTSDEHLIITINRQEIGYKQNNIYSLCMDLSIIDLDKINDFEALFSRLLTKNIKKVIFINNAFSMGTLAKIDELENTEILKIFNVNIVSSVLLIKSFIHQTRYLSIDKRILNISSGAARKAIDGWSTYCMSKSSLEMLIEGIKIEYSSYKCFNIDPGAMDTQMQSQIRDFKKGTDNQYFLELFRNKKLKSTNEVVSNINEMYIL